MRSGSCYPIEPTTFIYLFNGDMSFVNDVIFLIEQHLLVSSDVATQIGWLTVMPCVMQRDANVEV